MSNTRRANSGKPSRPVGAHGRGKKAVVGLLIGIVALTTLVGTLGFVSQSSPTPTPATSASASASAAPSVTNPEYIRLMTQTWDMNWTTASAEQNRGICDLWQTQPGEFFSQVGVPSDLPSTMTVEQYDAELAKFFEAKCPTLDVAPKDAAAPLVTVQPTK